MIPIIPIAIAGVAGAAAALLLSPHSGQENREIAAEKLKINEARDLVTERVANIRKKDGNAAQGESEPIEIESEDAPKDEAAESDSADPEDA